MLTLLAINSQFSRYAILNDAGLSAAEGEQNAMICHLNNRTIYRRNIMTVLDIDVFFSFRSPWSYFAAQAAGRGIEFAQSISAVIWNGTVDGWHVGDPIVNTAQHAGLALPQLQRWILDNSDQWQAELAKNNADVALHHWGVPTMAYAGELFFGQDKIDLLLWRLKQHGLPSR